MGVIKQQSIKGTIVTYIGVILGFIGTIFVYPLDKSIYGEIQTWISNGNLLVPILTLGSNVLIIKYYKTLTDQFSGGFITFLLKVTISSILLSTLIIGSSLFIIDYFKLFQENEFLTLDNIIVTYITSILLIFSSLFRNLSAAQYKIVVPTILDSIGLKVFTIGITLGAIYYQINSQYIFYFFILYYLTTIIILVVYNYRLNTNNYNNFKLSDLSPELRKEIKSFWIFTGLNVFGTLLAYKIDVSMIGTLISYEMVTIYLSFLTFSNIIKLPAQSLLSITGPLVSEALRENDNEKVANHYLMLSKNLLIIGTFFFIILWLNMDEILSIMKNGEAYRPFKLCFLFLGLSKLIDMSTSINHQIITYSSKYKINIILLFISATVNIISNIYFINLYGIIGVAAATTLSILIYNIIKTVIIYRLINVQPYQIKMLPSLVILVIVILIPPIKISSFFLISSLIKSSIFTILYVGLIYYTKASEEFNSLTLEYYNKLKNR